MPLKICVLASGSAANCTYVASERTEILIDAGLSGSETAVRLKAIGEDLATVRAICVTHEHDDHKASLGVLHRRYGTELYANAGTVEAIGRSQKQGGLPWNVFTTGSSFRVGDLDIHPFQVPHDSYEPVGFVVGDGCSSAGVVTDMGVSTGLVRERLRSCQVLVLECNHDSRMLKDAARPWSLKQRIAGRQGHLSNDQAAALLADIVGPGLRAVFLAHLSRDCNTPELASDAVGKVLADVGFGGVQVELTHPDRPSAVVAF